jgi:hypothetical protein
MLSRSFIISVVCRGGQTKEGRDHASNATIVQI